MSTATHRADTPTVVAGGPNDFLTARHLVLTGGHAAIGRGLAEEARTRFGWAPPQVTDLLLNRARRRWFERNWPQHHARMVGVAEAFGLDPERNDIDLSSIASGNAGFGCSAVWFPPSASTDGHGRIGRNFDFFTGDWMGMLTVLEGSAPAGEPSGPRICANPYVIHLAPDDGPASTAISLFGFDGVTEGINEHGLAVALLLSDFEGSGPDPSARPKAGLNSTQVPRFLLDTCADVDQAKEALLATKQYDDGAPCHYLIADATGRGFAWEWTPAGGEHIIEVENGPLCVTNHMLHRYPDVEDLPADNEKTHQTFKRIRTLTERTRGTQTSPAGLRAVMEKVEALEAPAWRTIWRSVFDLDERTMSTRFYLGDTPQEGVRYSDEVLFLAARTSNRRTPEHRR